MYVLYTLDNIKYVYYIYLHSVNKLLFFYCVLIISYFSNRIIQYGIRITRILKEHQIMSYI